MNFGDILDEWDRSTAKPCGKKKIDESRRRDEARQDASTPAPSRTPKELPKANPMDVWLRRYGLEDKDAALEQESDAETPAARRRRLHAMKCEAVLDLHGLTREEAWIRLETFIADSVRRGLSKVLVIHGKGSHSDSDPVLKQMVRSFIEQNSHAGESGPGGKTDGGSGSTWILLK